MPLPGARAVAAIAAAAVLWLAAGSTARAQTIIPTPSAPDFKLLGRVFSEADVIAAATQTVAKPIRWGRFVPYVGIASIGVTAIVAGLDWFYQQAQQATGTSLDEWYAGSALNGFPDFSGDWITPCGDGTCPSNYSAISAATRAAGVSCQVNNIIGSVYGSFEGQYRARARLTWNSVMVAESKSGFEYPSSAAALEASKVRLFNLYQAHVTNPAKCGTGSSVSLQDALTDPAAASALANTVLPDWAANREAQGWWPYTYAEPYGAGVGIELDDPPNINQWYDNPYANPQTDTDGDGFSDWQEVIVGTDPTDPNEYPTTTPDPYQDTDGDGWTDHEERAAGTDPYDDQDYPGGTPDPEPVPDLDGDGIPDHLDPCPFDALNRCADAVAEPLEIPDDYAREVTAARSAAAGERTASASEAIRDELQRDLTDEDLPVLAAAEFAEMDVSPLAEWTPDMTPVQAVLDGVLLDLESELSSLKEAADGKMPFGVLTLLTDIPEWTAESPCFSWSVHLPVVEDPMGVSLCDTPVDGFLVDTLRPVLVALLTAGFLFATVRSVVSSI